MKTFSEFQEGVASLALKGGSKLIPALMTGIGAAGTILQARKKGKRKIGSMEKRLYDRQKTNTDQSDDLIKAKPSEVEKQNKLVDRYSKKYRTPKQKTDTQKLLRDLSRGEVIQDEFSAPTNSDWREELSEGAKTRLVVKGLKAIKSVIKKGGKKITRDVGSIGGSKAAGRLNVDPELIKQFPGINLRKLAYPQYKANRNPKLAKAIQIAKDKIEKAKIAISSPGSDAKKLISKKEKGEYVPPTEAMSKKIRDILKKINEDTMAAPTNSTGPAVPGTGDDSSTVVVKKKKRYIYGGKGSRKMWMNNK